MHSFTIYHPDILISLPSCLKMVLVFLKFLNPNELPSIWNYLLTDGLFFAVCWQVRQYPVGYNQVNLGVGHECFAHVL